MENNYKKLQNIVQQGYDLEFGLLLEKAFENFKKSFGAVGIGLILLCILVFAIFFGMISVLVGIASVNTSLVEFNPMSLPGVYLALYFVISILTASVISVFNAGFFKMVDQAENNEGTDINTMFYFFKTHHFKEIFLASGLISIMTTGATLLFQMYEYQFVGLFVNYIISFLTFLTVPLIIFADLKALEAIGIGIRLVLKNPLMNLGLMLLAVVLSMLGLIAFCIGIFFTIPFLFSMIYVIYTAIFPNQPIDVIDQIGTDENH